MSVFTNLLRLYKSGSGAKTPLENYCTECLAGILRSDQAIMNLFAKEVLDLDSEENFNLKTQSKYFIDGDSDGIIDMVFESADTICFLENKVISMEAYDQLNRYYRILESIGAEYQKKTHLRYCTLFIDEKESFKNNPSFAQFRWKDIAEFFSDKGENNQLINEFYQFLKDNKMAGNERFTYNDILGLQVYSDVTQKVDELFNTVDQHLKAFFGPTKGGINATKQVTTHKRLALWCDNIIGDGYSEVIISIIFNGGLYGEDPVLSVNFYIDRKNSEYARVSAEANKWNPGLYKEHESNSGGIIRFQIPFTAFLDTEDQFTGMTNWIIEHIQKLAEFKESTPGLNWKV